MAPGGWWSFELLQWFGCDLLIQKPGNESRGGSFLLTPFTIRTYRAEYFSPFLSRKDVSNDNLAKIRALLDTRQSELDQ